MIKYKIRGIGYECNEETGECCVTGAGEKIRSCNPVEAFNMFWMRAGAVLLSEIRSAIEKQGFDPYTGGKNGT